MTRPPLAEFSSLAIRKLTEWVMGNAVWDERLREVLSGHFLPVAEESGLDPGAAWEELGDFIGPIYGAALEDLCARRYDDPPQNVVSDFLKKSGLRLAPPARKYLEALRDSSPGIYEVIAVRPGQGVTVRDLLIEGNPIEVIEISGSRQIVQWDRLAARIVEHGGNRVFTGALFPLAKERGKALIEELKGMLQKLAQNTGVASEVFRGEAIRTMREAAPRIAGLQVAQTLERLHPSLPKVVNREGDPYQVIEACYPLASGKRKQVAACLDTEARLRRTGVRPPTWDWEARASEHPSSLPSAEGGLAIDVHPDGDTDRVVLANLKLSGKQLEVAVNSSRRLQNTRALIEALLGELVGEPGIVIKSVEEAMAGHRHTAAQPRSAVPRRIEREALRRYLDSHYRSWLDEKIPALGGKTPREAARDFEGRAQLIELLKDLENLEARRAKDTGVGFDALWLWRELGIDHLRR